MTETFFLRTDFQIKWFGDIYGILLSVRKSKVQIFKVLRQKIFNNNSLYRSARVTFEVYLYIPWHEGHEFMDMGVSIYVCLYVILCYSEITHLKALLENFELKCTLLGS